VLYNRPRWLRAVPLNSTTAQVLYALWQFSLPAVVRQLQAVQRFELAQHLTYGVFRHPSFLYGLGIPFIFGPLGGGEDAPAALKKSLRGRGGRSEGWRVMANQFARWDPLLRRCLARSSLILVKTPQTRSALPRPFRKRAVVYPEIGIDAPEDQAVTQRKPGEPLRALFAGRLLGWKGAHLALMAVAEARRLGHDVELDIVGAGPFESELRRWHGSLALGDKARFVGRLPQAELFAMYRSAHVFLFPSLHDSSGNVVLEAQAFGCPVICLDLGGPATLVTPETACVVPTAGANEGQVVTRLAQALGGLCMDEARRRERALAALAHARTLTWERRVKGCLDLARRHGLLPDLPKDLAPQDQPLFGTR
jgi:glycosyltransferase involved in cell wall biosynthesis